MSKRTRRRGDAMPEAERLGVYYRQNGMWRLTQRQAKRLKKKANAGRAS